MEFALDFSRALLRESAEITNKDARESAVKRALSIGNAAKLKPMLEIARADRRVRISNASEWNSDPFVLGVQNGMVDLRTCGFLQPDRKAMVSKVSAATFDASAQCPKWEAFMERVLPDPEVRRFMQVSAGYWLTGDTGAQVFWFLFGSGANGKSTFLETIFRLSGDYAHRGSNTMLAISQNGRESLHELAALPGVRLLVGSEMADGLKLNTELVKDITGQDTISARELYRPPFNFKPSCKLVMFGNHKPNIAESDNGIWRRPRLIPFTQTIPLEERNPKLLAELWEERSGILNWCLDGLREWWKSGLVSPPAVLSATESYRESSDILGEFLKDRAEVDGGSKVQLKDLYECYTNWCSRTGHKGVLSDRNLRSRLEERGFESKQNKHGRVIVGLSIKQSNDPFEGW